MASIVPEGGVVLDKGPWYRTATFWKRFFVFMSIVFSVGSLILSAIASLQPESPSQAKRLTIAGIIINSFSISFSALTSLNWQSKSTQDLHFANQLIKISHLHEGNQIVITGRKIPGDETASS